MTRLTVAFASAAHARSALRFIAHGSLEHAVSPVTGGQGPNMAIVDVDLAPEDVCRMRVLLDGVRGLVIAECDDAPTTDRSIA